MTFEERQQLAIQMVALLWKTASQYSDNDLFSSVCKMMDDVITAADMEDLEKVMEGFKELRKKVEASAEETLWYLEHNWKMGNFDLPPN